MSKTKCTIIDKSGGLLGGKTHTFKMQRHGSPETIELKCGTDILNGSKGDLVEIEIKKVGKSEGE